MTVAVAVVGLFVHRLLQPETPVPSGKAVQTKTVTDTKKRPSPPKPAVSTFEIYPKETPKKGKPLTFKKKPPRDNGLPRIAIIIDDLGYNQKIARRFINLHAGLTLSVLPFSPFGREIASYGRRRGAEIMLHLPMEPFEYPRVDPGSGALLTSMTPDQLIRQLNRDLDSIPDIVGVNNHMGSRMTTESERMNQVFTVLKKRKLFFIDSRTTAKTMARSSAKLLKVKFGERSVFLDHTLAPDAIRKELQRLVHVAYEKGTAIGIGHPHRITHDIIHQELPGLRKKVRILPASSLVKVIG